MIRADLDHVAVAADQQDDLWPRYAGDLGGRWVSGGAGIGFAAAQLRYANGMRVEALEPHRADENDFLRRFLQRSGPGPHHLTFKAPDLAAALPQMEAAGYRPVGVDLSDPQWKESFLHPKDAPGLVVQVAQAAAEWVSEAPVGFPSPRHGQTASLVHVGHAVAVLDDGIRLFVGLLGGQETARGRTDEYEWADVTWPGAGRVRLLHPTGAGPLADWIGDRAGRIHHIAFADQDPAGINGAKPGADPRVWVIDPADNLGTRLLLAEPDSTAFAGGAIG